MALSLNVKLAGRVYIINRKLAVHIAKNGNPLTSSDLMKLEPSALTYLRPLTQSFLKKICKEYLEKR